MLLAKFKASTGEFLSSKLTSISSLGALASDIEIDGMGSLVLIGAANKAGDTSNACFVKLAP